MFNFTPETTQNPKPLMSFHFGNSLNSLRGYIGDYIGDYYRGY